MQLNEFKENVIKWAKERGIIPNSTFDAQYIKLVEELGELALGIRKRDEKIIKDSVGDVAVVLCVLAGLENFDYFVNDFRFVDTQGISNLNYSTFQIGVLGIGRKMEKWQKAEEVEVCLYLLKEIANEFEYDFFECLDIAWNEIKDRKGYLRKDGIFIKEADYKQPEPIRYESNVDNTFNYPTNIKNKGE